MSKLLQQRALQEVYRSVHNQLCVSGRALSNICWTDSRDSPFNWEYDELLQKVERDLQQAVRELEGVERLFQDDKEEIEKQQEILYAGQGPEAQGYNPQGQAEQQDLGEARRELEEQKQHLQYQEQVLLQRERQVEKKEEALKQRWQRLDAWEAALQREAAVRQDRKTALTSLREIQGAMMEIQRHVRQLGPTFRDINEHVNGGFAIGGLQDLIRCSRSLYQLGSDEAKYYAAELEQILANDFGCKKIQPTIGQPLDLLTMSKVDDDDLGQQVKTVLYAGWSMGETVLEKAVVSVMEG